MTSWLSAASALVLATLATAPAPRRELLDRHGHVVGHDPPLQRDAACAPDLWGALPRDGQLHARLDGGLQALALRAVQRGVERLARHDAAALPAAAATVSAVFEDHLTLRLADGRDAVLPLPPAVACAGHELPPLPAPAARFQVGDRLRVRAGAEAALTLQPQAALVALDPLSRDVLALVGGYHQRAGDFDRAVQGRRQAGSTWKPLVYAAALASGRYTLADTVPDLPRIYEGKEGPWRPRNFQDSYRGPVTLRQALAHSVNSVAVRLLADTGAARVAALAAKMGIPAAQVPRDLTQALGTALVSPLQLAGAYATLADTRAGRYRAPRLWDGAETPGEGDEAGAAALSPALAYLISSALTSVIDEGSAVRARELNLPHLRGKTGTTSNGQDAWFVGYHGGLLAVVWVGEDAARGASERTGADAALPIWMDFMQAAASHGYAPQPLPRPPGLHEVPLPAGGTELALDRDAP